MAIAEQFAGLQMDQLIGAPLRAAADASKQLADSTAEFINRVGFDREGKVRTVAFGYQKHSVNEDGTSNLDEMKVDVPMLAIVPIPNLQVDEVNILFDMEVKQSEKQESSTDMGASVTGSARIGFIKVKVTGSVSAHQSHTRSSDNSAKYHVDVRATNHGIPEGLARVLDMMAANVAPMLVGSTLKDENGQNLSDKAKQKAERLKALRQEISQLEKRLGAAQDSLDNSIQQLKTLGDKQWNAYRGAMMKRMDEIDMKALDKAIADAPDTEKEAAKAKKAEAEKQMSAFEGTMEEINQSWSTFESQTGALIKLLADSGDETEGVSTMFSLKAADNDGKTVDYTDGTCYKMLAATQKNAVANQNSVGSIEKELFDKKAEYSDAMAGKA